MPAKTPGERLDRLEQVVQIIAEEQVIIEKNHKTLQQLVADLATATSHGFDQLAKQFKETDRRMRETDDRMKQTDDRMKRTDDRMRETDQRIDKLVVAIGELIRSQKPS